MHNDIRIQRVHVITIWNTNTFRYSCCLSVECTVFELVDSGTMFAVVIINSNTILSFEFELTGSSYFIMSPVAILHYE